MSRTAMMMLINWIDEMENHPVSITASNIELKMLSQFKDKAKSLLEEEKRNIVMARASMISDLMNIPLNVPMK